MRRRFSPATYGRGVITGGFFAGLVLASPWSASLWEVPAFSSLFQFPFRFLALTILCGPWFIASSVEYLRASRPKLIGLYAVLGLISIIPILSAIEFVNRPEGYYTTNEATTTVANEYMPRWAGGLPAERNSNRIEIFEGRGIIEPRTVNTQQIDVDLNLEEDSILTINSIYYPGWGNYI